MILLLTVSKDQVPLLNILFYANSHISNFGVSSSLLFTTVFSLLNPLLVGGEALLSLLLSHLLLADLHVYICFTYRHFFLPEICMLCFFFFKRLSWCLPYSGRMLIFLCLFGISCTYFYLLQK